MNFVLMKHFNKQYQESVSFMSEHSLNERHCVMTLTIIRFCGEDPKFTCRKSYKLHILSHIKIIQFKAASLCFWTSNYALR
jgi:hypothetical protein